MASKDAAAAGGGGGGGGGGGAAAKDEDEDVHEDSFKTFAQGGGMQADVDELITQYRVKIDRLRERVIDIVPQDDPQYDDLFYLRYVLSFKAKTTKCVEPIRFTVDYRNTHKAMFAKIHADGVHAVPHHTSAMRFNCTGMSGTLPTGEPIWVVRTGHSMQTQLMNTLTKDEVAEWLLMSKEVQWHLCDAHTRRTRKLTKMITVIDFEGYSMGASDRRFFKALGDSSKASAKCYPQLLGKTVIVNAPSFFRWMFKVFSVFQPKSSIEKMAICPVKKSSEKSARDCPWLSRLAGLDSVPPFLGGGGACPPELEPFSARADALTHVHVGARSAADPVTVDAPAGATVNWEIILKSHGINVAFTYTTATDPAPKPIDIEGGEGGVIKVQADNGLTVGSIVMPEDGVLSCVFDNRHSMFRNKNLEYRIEVEAPAGLGDDGAITAEELAAAKAAATAEEEEEEEVRAEGGGAAAPALPAGAE